MPLELVVTKRTDPRLLACMENHYSKPKGFVGRNICYAIMYDGIYYGHIVAGSATLHLVGRNEFFGIEKSGISQIINNIFFHVEKVGGKYPKRNFSTFVLEKFMEIASQDWTAKYGDKVLGFETLVELPRTGELYLRAGFVVVGETKGYTCKRIGGVGTDSYSGKRVWDTKNLRPKLVLCKSIDR